MEEGKRARRGERELGGGIIGMEEKKKVSWEGGRGG